MLCYVVFTSFFINLDSFGSQPPTTVARCSRLHKE